MTDFANNPDYEKYLVTFFDVLGIIPYFPSNFANFAVLTLIFRI